jgi:hypothetical protein
MGRMPVTMAGGFAGIGEKLFGLRQPRLLDLDRMIRESKGTSLFRRLRFERCTTDFVEPTTVWRELERFCAAPAPFSWWLITGSAGTGKSRALFEFCQMLRAGRGEAVEGEQFSVAWDAGFLSLDDTPLDTWDAWWPMRHTLLVLDDVTRDRREAGDEVVKIIARLVERAKENELRRSWLKKGRVRVVLLAREHGEQGEDCGQSEWYGRLDVDSRHREALEFSPLADEGLHAIAQDALRLIWKSPAADLPGFIEKLEAVDKEKRPLFAMLLAGYLGEKGADEGRVTQRDVLDFAIEKEFARKASLGKDERLLETLIVSSLTGGRVGGGDEDAQEPGYPLEPNLLGEYFVLESAGKKEDGQRRVAVAKTQELIEAAWGVSPEEVCGFFCRCIRDFSFDPAWIETLFLNESMAGAGEEVKQAYLFASLVIVDTLREKGDLAGAWKVLQAIAGSGYSELVQVLRAKQAFKLLTALGEAGRLDEARMIFGAMRDYGQTDEVRALCAKAAVNLVIRHATVKRLSEAREICDDIAALGNTKEVQAARSVALKFISSKYA